MASLPGSPQVTERGAHPGGLVLLVLGAALLVEAVLVGFLGLRQAAKSGEGCAAGHGAVRSVQRRGACGPPARSPACSMKPPGTHGGNRARALCRVAFRRGLPRAAVSPSQSRLS